MKLGKLHEHLTVTTDDTKPPSERNFGLTFTVVFAVIGILPLLYGGALRWWSLVVSAIILALTFLAPSALFWPNQWWFRFGLLLHRVVNPVVLGAMYYLAITPMALFMRALGKKLLDMQFDPDAKSYWIERQPPGPSADSVRRPF